MTLDQWRVCCESAIRSHFQMRNIRVFQDQARHERLIGARRSGIRHWVKELRLATNPATAQFIADRVRMAVN